MYSKEFKDKYLTIVSVLKNERVKNLTQKELAVILKISEGTIKSFESGKIIRPDVAEQYTSMFTDMNLTIDFK